ncbi:MAG: hypothetical protein ACN6QC_21345, partial [Paraburkholderia hospita]
QTLQFKPVTVFRLFYQPVAHSKSLTKDLITQTFLNYFCVRLDYFRYSVTRRSPRAAIEHPHLSAVDC